MPPRRFGSTSSRAFPSCTVAASYAAAGRSSTCAVFAHVLDLPAAAYEAATVQDGNALELVLPNLLGGIPYGFALRKDEADLAAAVSAALQQMIDDGSYAVILEKYGLEGGAVDEATINGGTTSAS